MGHVAYEFVMAHMNVSCHIWMRSIMPGSDQTFADLELL